MTYMGLEVPKEMEKYYEHAFGKDGKFEDRLAFIQFLEHKLKLNQLIKEKISSKEIE